MEKELMTCSRSLVLVVTLFILCMCLTLHSAPFSGRLRATAGGSDSTAAPEVFAASANTNRLTNTEVDFESSLRATLEEVLEGRDGSVAQQIMIEASLQQTFEALPKNSMDRLQPRAIRYIMSSYFAKTHGWLIKGLETHGTLQSAKEVHDVSILRDKLPMLVKAYLNARQSHGGLSFDDVVVIVAALERLVYDESVMRLQTAYNYIGEISTGKVDLLGLHEILKSYLLLTEKGSPNNTMDVHRHEFEHDAVLNFDYLNRHRKNPFVAKEYLYKDVSRIAESITRDYSMWQNTKCKQMKEDLMDLDRDGSGRVLLSDFYAQPDAAGREFTESPEYLRQVGALEESIGRGPKVRIANYLAGPSKCITHSNYYAICCLSECADLLHDLEGETRAPMAPPQELLEMVGNLSSSSVTAPRELPKELAEKLYVIAARHDGKVPLHSRLFAQWLHYAFPNECPYPNTFNDAAGIAGLVQLEPGMQITASLEERQRHVEAAVAAAASTTSESEGQAPSGEQVLSMEQWSDDEVLLLSEPPPPPQQNGGNIVVMLMVFSTGIWFAFLGLRMAKRRVAHREGYAKKYEDFYSPSEQAMMGGA